MGLAQLIASVWFEREAECSIGPPTITLVDLSEERWLGAFLRSTLFPQISRRQGQNMSRFQSWKVIRHSNAKSILIGS